MIIDARPVGMGLTDKISGQILVDRPTNGIGINKFEDAVVLQERLRGMPYGLLLALTIPVDES